MVKIRLRRTGKKKQASFRVVVADSRKPRDGRFIEIIGFYNPRTEPATFRVEEDRALYWLSQGAQVSDAVARLLKKQGTLDRFARLKAGEDLEALLAEAAAEAEEAEAEEVAEEAEAEEAAPLEEEEAPPEEAEPAAEEEPAEEAAAEEEEAPVEEETAPEEEVPGEEAPSEEEEEPGEETAEEDEAAEEVSIAD
jgi:small subunit ribosomal protein S16